jgi:general stress protein YciG
MANDNAASNLSQEDRAKGGSKSPGNFKHDKSKARRAGKMSGGGNSS